MLAHVGLLTEAELADIVAGLQSIADAIRAGTFQWDIALEDVHMNIEQALSQRVPAAAKLHTGRSRNDQVATDMRLFFRDAAQQVQAGLQALMRTLVDCAEANAAILIPGYTHLQRAQPVSVAHHLLAYVEMLERDRQRVRDFAARANVCPLGSSAIAGSTLPLDRAFTATALGFVHADGSPAFTQNSMDAVADRDAFIEFAHACAQIALHLSRMAEDLILWSSSEFNFVRLPDAYTTGSSLMPQKKNPDSLELIRGKSARICSALNALMLLTKGLPLTYNRDLQEDKPPVFDALDATLDCLRVMQGTIAGMHLRPEACAKAVSDPMLLATDVVDYLVLKGLPFRDAHHVVGKLVALSEQQLCPLPALPLDAVQAVCPLLQADWIHVFDPQTALERRDKPGMPAPAQTRQRLCFWRSQLG